MQIIINVANMHGNLMINESVASKSCFSNHPIYIDLFGS